MKILDKLKNALFEEEYVEVEEKPVKAPKPKPKKEKPKRDVSSIKEEKRLKNVKLTTYEDEEKKEEPIAKKILPTEVEEKKEKKVNESVKPKKEEFNFPTISDDEFVEKDFGDIKVTEIEDDDPSLYHQDEEDIKLYKTSKEDEYIKKYTANEYGNYEKTKEKRVFKPSPNISPIFGIIDDDRNGIKSQPKKEVRLTSVVRNEKIGVDDVRKKAYGIIDNSNTSRYQYEENSEQSYDNMLVDLRDDSLPEVQKVTVADAEEYFEDLGLEYNTDYIDAKKAKASGRRLKSEEEYDTPKVEENSVEENVPDFLKEMTSEEISDDRKEETDDDNLFDLIDSMYDK